MKKAVVTVLGQDKVGITAKICGVLAETNINILDISQTIVGCKTARRGQLYD